MQKEEFDSLLELHTGEIEELRDISARREARIAELEHELDAAHEAEQAVGQGKQAARQQNRETTTRLAGLQTRYQELLKRYEQNRRKHAEEVASLTRQLSELRERYERRLAELSNELERRVDWPGQRDRRPGAPGAQRPSAPARTVPPPVQNAAPTSGDAPILMIDDSPVGVAITRKLGRFGYLTCSLNLKGDLNAQLEDHNIPFVAVNLALPGTWEILRRLRSLPALGLAPIIAYAMAERGDTGYWFGLIDVITIPLRLGELTATLRRLAPKLNHVVAVGPADDVIGNARKELFKEDLSMTVARDRRHALEAVRAQYPQVALVHAAPNPVDGFRTIAGIRALAIFKDLPAAFLLNESAAERDTERLAAGARTLLRLGSLQSHRLVDFLVRALNDTQKSGEPS